MSKNNIQKTKHIFKYSKMILKTLENEIQNSSQWYPNLEKKIQKKIKLSKFEKIELEFIGLEIWEGVKK